MSDTPGDVVDALAAFEREHASVVAELEQARARADAAQCDRDRVLRVLSRLVDHIKRGPYRDRSGLRIEASPVFDDACAVLNKERESH